MRHWGQVLHHSTMPLPTSHSALPGHIFLLPTNMNANEVIANRAGELMGGRRGSKSVHPNDHVNHGQSSNDVIPSAIHLAVLEGITRDLIPALQEVQLSLWDKALEFRDVLKIGRTHLQDATPMWLGQEFGGYARQVEHGIE